MVNVEAWQRISKELAAQGVTLVAVSKTKPVEDIQALYDLGQRDFGENYVQELAEKKPALPPDIRWHYIGHLQSNKVKYIAPFVSLVHAVDSFKLLHEINKQAQKNGRTIDILLQLHIANEETKFGLDENELVEVVQAYKSQESELLNIQICGLMGMSTDTSDSEQIKSEFALLKSIFDRLKKEYFDDAVHFSTCSMGMSNDYKLAILEGSNMVRIGSLLFGQRK